LEHGRLENKTAEKCTSHAWQLFVVVLEEAQHTLSSDVLQEMVSFFLDQPVKYTHLLQMQLLQRILAQQANVFLSLEEKRKLRALLKEGLQRVPTGDREITGQLWRECFLLWRTHILGGKTAGRLDPWFRGVHCTS
jgi:hypothetical protein